MAAPPLWVLRAAFRTMGYIAPGVVARWAEIIFCRPPRHDPRPAEEAFLATSARTAVSLALHRGVAGPGAELLTTTGLGHRALLRNPDVVRRTIEFLGRS